LPNVADLLVDLFFFISLLIVVIGGVGLIWYAVSARQRMRELMIRERIALIEKGLAPPPEVNPARFEQVLGDRPFTVHRYSFAARSARYRSAGIMVMGFGTALLLLLAVTAPFPVAVGVGGGFIVLGAALFVNGMMWSREKVPLNEMGTPVRADVPPSQPNGM
jgi:hypothetical protein